MGTVPGTEHNLNTPMDQGCIPRDLGNHGGVAAPEGLQGLVGQAGLISQGPRHLPPFLLFPRSQVKRAAAGPLDQGQTGGRAGGGEPSGTGRKEGIVCRNPTEGPGPRCEGFFREKQTCLSFYQLLLKQPIGFDSLPFHPKQMINK